MSCSPLTAGILKDCANNAGGNRRLWLTEKSNVTVTVPSPNLGYKEVTLAVGTKFWKFEFTKKGGLEYSEDRTGSPENGSEFYLQKAILKLTRREKAKRTVLLLLSHYKELSGIIEDGNGLFWLIGEADGLILTEMPSGTGADKTGSNGYTLTLTAEEDEPANELTAAHIATLKAGGFIDNL